MFNVHTCIFHARYLFLDAWTGSKNICRFMLWKKSFKCWGSDQAKGLLVGAGCKRGTALAPTPIPGIQGHEEYKSLKWLTLLFRYCQPQDFGKNRAQFDFQRLFDMNNLMSRSRAAQKIKRKYPAIAILWHLNWKKWANAMYQFCKLQLSWIAGQNLKIIAVCLEEL